MAAMSVAILTNNRRIAYGTGAVAIALTHAIPGPCELLNVEVHLSAAAGAENLVISRDSILGAAYDAVLSTTAMNGLTDVHYLPTVPIQFQPGDVLSIAFANSGSATVGVVANFRLIEV